MKFSSDIVKGSHIPGCINKTYNNHIAYRIQRIKGVGTGGALPVLLFNCLQQTFSTGRKLIESRFQQQHPSFTNTRREGERTRAHKIVTERERGRDGERDSSSISSDVNVNPLNIYIARYQFAIHAPAADDSDADATGGPGYQTVALVHLVPGPAAAP